MPTIIAWERADGGISYEMPSYGDDTRPTGDTDDALIERCKAKTGPRLEATYGGPATSHLIRSEDLLTDDTFRDAWEWRSDAVNVNMSRARVIHLATIREARDLELGKEDINMLRAIEAGDTSAQSTVATRKQTLRDIPATFDITTDVDTPEQLKAKWPSELPARE